MENEQVTEGEAPTGNGTEMGAKTGNTKQEVAAAGAGKTGKTKPTRKLLKRKDTSTEYEAQAAKKKRIEEDEEPSSEEEDMETDTALTKRDFLKGLKRLHKKLDKVAGLQDVKIESMQSEIDELREEIVELRNEMDQLHVITRKKKLMFTGIPEDPEEQPVQTYRKVRNFVQHELKLDADIDTVRRVGSKSKGTGRRILVTFRSARTVEMIMENKHPLRNNRKQKVYINRDEPPRIEQAKAEERKERKISEEYYNKYHPEERNEEPHGSQKQTRNQQRHVTPAEDRKRQTHDNQGTTRYHQKHVIQNYSGHNQRHGSQNQRSHNRQLGGESQSNGNQRDRSEEQESYYQRHERSVSRQPEQNFTGGWKTQGRNRDKNY